MKAKLLKIVRRTVKLLERNGSYYVNSGNFISSEMTKNDALDYYRNRVIYESKSIFGFKPKSRVK